MNVQSAIICQIDFLTSALPQENEKKKEIKQNAWKEQIRIKYERWERRNKLKKRKEQKIENIQAKIEKERKRYWKSKNW